MVDNKKNIKARLDSDLWDRFKSTALKKYGYTKGRNNKALAEALNLYVNR